MKRALTVFFTLTTVGWLVHTNLGLVNTASSLLDNFGDEMGTKFQMYRLATMVTEYCKEEGLTPPSNLKRVLKANVKTSTTAQLKEVATDPWGTVYRVGPVKQGFQILSAGPDKKWKTRDDLKLYRSLAGTGLEPDSK